MRRDGKNHTSLSQFSEVAPNSMHRFVLLYTLFDLLLISVGYCIRPIILSVSVYVSMSDSI